jgi:hypothetical protein
LEALRAGRSLHDLDGPWPQIGQGIQQLVPAIDPVGQDVVQVRPAAMQRPQQRHSAMVVLHAGLVHQAVQHKALAVGGACGRGSAWQRPARAGRRFSVVGTLWLSMMPRTG